MISFRLMALAAAVSAAVLSMGTTRRAEAQTFSVPNFVNESLFFGDGTTALDFGPTGTLYVAEKRGRLLYLTPDGQGGYNSPQLLLDLTGVVDSTLEAGMLGIAVDPDHAINRHIFILYTTSTDQRVVRYTLDAAGTSASEETVIVPGLPRTFDIHKAGDIQFRPGEPTNLYIALGDDGIPAEAQSINNLRGSILRVDKVSGLGLETNPFYDGGALDAPRARIWSIGMRNPFRFTFHPIIDSPSSDVLYVSENGDTTDKMAWVRAGSNGGWSEDGDGPFINVADPEHRVLFSGVASHIGIAIAAAGPFSDGGVPVIYLSNWINPAGGSILRWALTGADLDTATALPQDNGSPFVTGFATTLRFGPDGSLYYTQSNTGDSIGGFYEVGRISFVGGDPPVAAFTTAPNPPEGPIPFTVSFTDASSDADGTVQSYAWNFGDGNTSTETNPSHTYTEAGNYTVQLVVTDDVGLTGTTQTRVSALSEFTLSLRGDILDGNELDGRRRAGTTQIRFYQRDGTPIAIANGVGPDGNGVDVTDGIIQVDVALNATSNFIVVTAGEAEANLATQTLAFAVPAGQATHTETITLTPASTAIRGQVLDTRDEPAIVDLGIARNDIAALYPIANGRDYLPGSAIGTTGVLHRVVSDDLGYYYFPLRDAGTYFIDVVGDTNANTYLATLGEQDVAATGTETDLNFTVGLQAGGADCDDLTAIAETDNVDYATQIQPLWSGCIGCHKPNSDNGGGLDLTEASSYAALVNISSSQVPGLLLVEPNDPDASYLLEKISCSNPQVGNRMRQGSPLELAQQALVRDWIAQGAEEAATGTPVDGGVIGVDGGAVGTDGGLIGIDGGTTFVDGGTTAIDGGFVAIDGGFIPVDGGFANVDGGVIGVDGGVVFVDGGATFIDGGTTFVDGGVVTNQPDPELEIAGRSSCHCVTGDTADDRAPWAIAVGLVALIGFRVRRRRHRN